MSSPGGCDDLLERRRSVKPARTSWSGPKEALAEGLGVGSEMGFEGSFGGGQDRGVDASGEFTAGVVGKARTGDGSADFGNGPVPERAVIYPFFRVQSQTGMAGNPDGWIPTRRSLLTRLKNWDDQESWKDFFDTYSKLIYSVALKAGLNETEAEEVVQETIIAVAKQMKRFKYDPAIGSFKGWLLHTTRWRINDQLRKRRGEGGAMGRKHKTSTRTATVERIPDPAASNLEDIWEQEWRKTMFEVAIGKVRRRVDPGQYQIFDAYVIKQWPVKKVIEVLGVSPGQVYLAKHRISALIKKEIANLEGKMI